MVEATLRPLCLQERATVYIVEESGLASGTVWMGMVEKNSLP